MDTNEYVCPKCGTNDNISECSLAWVEYRGQFDESGHIVMFDTETPIIGDNPDDPYTHYICANCHETFDEPISRISYEESLEQESCRA
jgi:hypothetical protein